MSTKAKNGVYTFDIVAEENREAFSFNMPGGVVLDTSKITGPYDGHDASPPDTQSFTLTITDMEDISQPEPEPDPTPPVFVEENHEYKFVFMRKDQDSSMPIYVKGSSPITYSIEQTGRYPLNEHIQITDKGVLSISKNIDLGTHYFTIKAQSPYGTATQECSLRVMLFPVFTGEEQGGDTPAFTTLFAEFVNPDTIFGFEWDIGHGSNDYGIDFVEVTPPNTVTYRHDDPNDKYTREQEITNGAAFIRWHSCPGMIDRSDRHKTKEGVGTVLYDNAPIVGSYVIPPLDGDKQEQNKHFEDALEAYRNQNKSTDISELMDNFFDKNKGDISKFKRPESKSTYLEYAGVIEKLKQKPGVYTVTLDEDTGTAVTKKYFSALKESKKSSLIFESGSLIIGFDGKDMHDEEFENIDLANYVTALNAEDILAKVIDGSASYTFGFAERKQLPGEATVQTPTDIPPGSTVNVYRYDEYEEEYYLIAEGLKVDAEGKITFVTDYLSEYLITTGYIANPRFTDLINRQPETGTDYLIYGLIGVGVLVLLGAAVLFYNKKKSG